MWVKKSGHWPIPKYFQRGTQQEICEKLEVMINRILKMLGCI